MVKGVRMKEGSECLTGLTPPDTGKNPITVRSVAQLSVRVIATSEK